LRFESREGLKKAIASAGLRLSKKLQQKNFQRIGFLDFDLNIFFSIFFISFIKNISSPHPALSPQVARRLFVGSYPLPACGERVRVRGRKTSATKILKIIQKVKMRKFYKNKIS
jgi:hypothetical protein